MARRAAPQRRNAVPSTWEQAGADAVS